MIQACSANGSIESITTASCFPWRGSSFSLLIDTHLDGSQRQSQRIRPQFFFSLLWCSPCTSWLGDWQKRLLRRPMQNLLFSYVAVQVYSLFQTFMIWPDSGMCRLWQNDLLKLFWICIGFLLKQLSLRATLDPRCRRRLIMYMIAVNMNHFVNWLCDKLPCVSVL